MELDSSLLINNMIEAIKRVFDDKKWSESANYIKGELEKLTKEMIEIQLKVATGKIDQETARNIMAIQKNAIRSNLLLGLGLERLAVEQVLNAALGAIKDTINTAIGFTLL